MSSVMTCCIILHNMIIEDKWGREDCDEYIYDDNFKVDQLKHDEGRRSTILEWQQVRNEYMSEAKHYQLRANQIEHLWQKERL
jgi:hypothetical protein